MFLFLFVLEHLKGTSLFQPCGDFSLVLCALRSKLFTVCAPSFILEQLLTLQHPHDMRAY